MDTQVIRVDRSGEFQKIVQDAGKVLAAGGLLVFPTETVYGLAARADHPQAMARLREIKGREVQQGFTVHLAFREDASKYVTEMPSLAARMMRKAWPGPLTLLIDEKDPASAPILSNRDGTTKDAIYYNGTVGLRFPDDIVARGILEQVDAPVVAASANPAGKPPPRSGEEVMRGLGGTFDMLVDAGPTRFSKASTIVKVKDGDYKLIREGVLDAGIIERMAVAHILFVCTGNTCRSPMAAGLARKILAERLGCEPRTLEKHGVKVTSAGTSGGGGPASSGALRVMSQRGVDLSEHSSTALTPDLIHQADHVFVMTRTHLDSVLSMAPWAKDKTSLLLGSQDVEDPVGLSDDVYEECARAIERGLRERLAEVPL